jgi:hypothetical protein
MAAAYRKQGDLDKTCDEKSSLAKEYELATTRFSEAVKKLRQRMGTSPKEEFGRLDRAANEERVKSERARLELEDHVAVHGCWAMRPSQQY